MVWNPCVFLAFVAMSFGLLAWLIYWVYRARGLAREERRLMIEKGMTPPVPEPQGWPAVRAREMQLKFEERRLRLEKGLDVPIEERTPRQPESYLLHGLLALCLGAGLEIGFLVFFFGGFRFDETEEWLAFLAVVSPVVALYGVANVVYYRQIRHRRTEPKEAPVR